MVRSSLLGRNLLHRAGFDVRSDAGSRQRAGPARLSTCERSTAVVRNADRFAKEPPDPSSCFAMTPLAWPMGTTVAPVFLSKSSSALNTSGVARTVKASRREGCRRGGGSTEKAVFASSAACRRRRRLRHPSSAGDADLQASKGRRAPSAPEPRPVSPSRRMGRNGLSSTALSFTTARMPELAGDGDERLPQGLVLDLALMLCPAPGSSFPRSGGLPLKAHRMDTAAVGKRRERGEQKGRRG